MNKLLFLLTLSISLCCSDILGQDQSNHNDSIKSKYDLVLINHVSFLILTPLKVNCHKLDIAFGDRVKSKVLTDSSQIDSLELLINNLEISDEKYFPDVRLEIYLMGKNKADDILCTDGTHIVFNGIPMKRNDELMKFIKRQIEVN